VIAAVLLCVAANLPGSLRRLEASATERALPRGIAWLLSQQASDGAWRSKTYGQLRGGAGNTALAVYALTAAWPELNTAQRSQVKRGIDFLVAHQDPAGFVRGVDAADYPTYGTALTAIAIERTGLPDWDMPRSRMLAYLRAAQCATAFQPVTDPRDVGGWGLTGGDPEDPSSFALANVSTTRLALEALRGEAPNADLPRASEFLGHLQDRRRDSPDYGGFHFVTAPDDSLNKAGYSKDGRDALHARAYASPTADGLLALRASGVTADDVRVKAVAAWLEKSRKDGTANVPAGLRYYRSAALAHVLTEAGVLDRSVEAERIAQELSNLQRPDGSWANDDTAMREDDPLVATAFAIEALATLQSLPGSASN